MTTCAVITGAGRGLGASIAERFEADGWRVIRADIADTDTYLDVTDAQACRELARRVQPDVWVNNAGVLGAGDAATQDDEVIHRVVSVNLLGVIHGTRAALAVMRERDGGRGSGHVINVGSLASWVPVPGECVYAASKAGVLSFTLGVAAEMTQQGVTGIHLGVICPDGMLTPMITEVLDDPAIAMTFTGLRQVQPEKVASEVVAMVQRPRRIVSVPHWRGAQVRVISAIPDLALRLAPVFMRLGRAGQDRVRQRLAR